ncbi:hypothetical protein BDW66DRAFT_146742 [Aspergillus desertorum]
MTEAQFAEWVRALSFFSSLHFITTRLATLDPYRHKTGGSGSCDLLPGLYYCVQVDFNTISTTSSVAIATPTPFEPGMVDWCTAFHPVVSGDTCGAIASDAEISLSDFEA